ncbi:MAG TPA: sigma-70 family RNA polymerase sigma factor [Candidatus Angelobacter sp.]|nr:sigma-70 family RNA polymerase sigma factor [Candidatus Angelobacter sp.]
MAFVMTGDSGCSDDAIAAQMPALRRYAMALTRSIDLAEELVQDCLMRALGRRHLFRDGMAVRPWLFTIMHNLHINNRRQALLRSVLTADRGDMPAEQVAPNQECVAELRKVVRALASLPQDQQRVLLLVVVWELSYREAASNLGIPIGTVMSRLARGRERLRELLLDGNSRDGPPQQRPDISSSMPAGILGTAAPGT